MFPFGKRRLKIKVSDVSLWRGRVLCLWFTNGFVAGGQLAALLGSRHREMAGDPDMARAVVLEDGRPTWPNGVSLEPDRLLDDFARAMRCRLMLEEENEALLIAKSGGPEPAREVIEGLVDDCTGRWRYRCDNSWNIHFEFEDEGDAAAFKQRWGAVDA